MTDEEQAERADEAASGEDPLVSTVFFFRRQQGHGLGFSSEPPPPPREPVRRPARVAVMLALAHKLEDAIDRGVVRDCVEVARRLGLTRPRVTQLLDLTLLAPDLQAAVLELESVDGLEPVGEHALRAITAQGDWRRQRELWLTIRGRR